MTRHSRHEVGPPPRRGHYSQDNRWWLDEAAGRWLPLTEERDTLEIELEDAGAPRRWPAW